MATNRRRSSSTENALGEIPQGPIARFCQNAIFFIILLVLIFSTMAFGAVRPWALAPIMIAVAFATCLWIVRLLAAHEAYVVFSPLAAPVLVLATYVVMRYTLAEVEPISRPDMMFAVTAALMFFLSTNNIRHRWQITTLVWTLVILGGGLALYGLGQAVIGHPWIWWFPQYECYRGAASGVFIRPTSFVVYLHMAAAMAGANFHFSRRSLHSKVVLILAGGLIFGGLLFSYAPAYWLGWLAAAAILVAYTFRKHGWKIRWFLLGLGISVVTAIFLLAATRSGRPHPPSSLVEQSMPAINQVSRATWQSAIKIGLKNPWLGSGPGMFRWLYPAHRTTQQRQDWGPNEYLTVFAEYGVTGLLLVLWVGIAFAIAAIQILKVRAKRYSAATASNRFAFTIGGLAIFAAVAVDAALGCDIRVGANLFTVLVIMAATLTCGVHHRSMDAEKLNVTGKYTTMRVKGPTLMVFIGSLVVLMGLMGSRMRQTFPAYFLVRYAEREQAQLRWTVAQKLYQRAWQMDHRNLDAIEALGDLYSARATWNPSERAAFFREALTWYDRLLTVNPYANDAFVKMARLHDLLGNREKAAAHYLRALDADPKNASYHAAYALHCQRWGDDTHARASAIRARDLGYTGLLPNIETTNSAAPGP
jgi:hypothetical protein